MTYPLKLIKWRDAYNSNHDWFDATTLPKEVSPFLVQTIGFEVQRTDTYITLAMSVAISSDGRKDLCDLFIIPVALVVREQTFRNRLK